MRQLLLLLGLCVALNGCVTHRTVAPAAASWERRMSQLQQPSSWLLSGRAAVATGTQGWQASLDWRQTGLESELHLAGPLGVGALVLRRTADGVSLNGAPPSEAVVMQLQERLGFDLPLDELQYWLLGVPDPDAPSDLTRNDQDRALQLNQAGWTLNYERYMPAGGDTLPARLVLSRDGVRVRIAVDRWESPRVDHTESPR